MTLTVLDPRTGCRVAVTMPAKQRVSQRARRWVLHELDRVRPSDGVPLPASTRLSPQQS